MGYDYIHSLSENVERESVRFFLTDLTQQLKVIFTIQKI